MISKMYFATILVFLTFLCMSGKGFGQDDLDSALKAKVDNFNMLVGLASQLSVDEIQQFCELVESQKKKIFNIKKEAKEKEKSIKLSDSSYKKKLEKLTTARDKQNELLLKLLTPEQRKSLFNFKFYQIILYEEGYANSIVNGFVAEHLELSVDERSTLKAAADKSREAYRDKLVKAQLAALKEVRDAVPPPKLEKFDQLMDIFKFGNETFWPVDDSALDTRRRLRNGALLVPLR